MFKGLLSKKKMRTKVIGVGCGGNNIVNHLIDCGMENLTFVACDLDAKVLEHSKATTLLQLGDEGFGAGNMADYAQSIAMKNLVQIQKLFDKHTELVFIVSCLGGGCGSGVPPIIAQVAKEKGIKVVGLVTIPFRFEGEPKLNQALDAAQKIIKNADTVFVLNNQYLIQYCGDKSVDTAFFEVDEMMCEVVKHISRFVECELREEKSNVLKNICLIFVILAFVIPSVYVYVNLIVEHIRVWWERLCNVFL